MVEVGKKTSLGERDGAPIPGIYLGEWKSREWYWNMLDNSIMWRVPEIRECIAAPPGFKVLAADYSQIEVKLMAFLSQDAGLLEALNSRDSEGNLLDFHCVTSAKVKGKKLNFDYELINNVVNGKVSEGWGNAHKRYKELKKIRGNIKTTTFGVPYGAGAQTIARQTGLTEEEAQTLIDDFFAEFPGLKKWLDQQGDLAITYGYTQTRWGRRRFYVRPPKSDPNYDAELKQIRRWAGNHPIQASNADMLKDALRRIYSRIRGGVLNGPPLYNAVLLLVVHDEIVMMVKEEDAEAVAKILADCMQEAYDAIITGIPNKIDVVIDDTWEKV